MNRLGWLGIFTRAGCLWVGSALLSISMTQASQIRSVNLEEMTARATTIFSGRCIEVRTVADSALGGDVSVARFEVHRAIKGGRERIVTVRMMTDDGGAGVATVPTFQQGDEVVLFLYGESALGVRSPVGLGQGRFKVTLDKRGQTVAVNDLRNRNLLRALSPAAKARLAQVSPAGEPDEELGPNKLLDMAEALVASAP